MSYNPARVGGQPNRNNKRRMQNPHAGVKRSQIAGRVGPQAVSFQDYQKRESTPFGWNIPNFKGKFFEVVYSYMCARNETGIIKHPKLDRSVRVLTGQIYLTIGEEVLTLNLGQTASLEAGVEYCLATTGVSDAELLFSQGSNYERGLVVVKESDAVSAKPAATAVAPREAEAIPTKKRNPVTMQNAQKMESARKGGRQPMKREKRPPMAGQTVVGANPQPIGAGGYGSD